MCKEARNARSKQSLLPAAFVLDKPIYRSNNETRLLQREQTRQQQKKLTFALPVRNVENHMENVKSKCSEEQRRYDRTTPLCSLPSAGVCVIYARKGHLVSVRREEVTWGILPR